MTQPTDEPVPAIDGSTYLSETVTGHLLVVGSRLRISFRDGQLGADAGCNQMGGAYDITDGVLVVGEMAMTEMACMEPPGLMEQEQWFAGFLQSGPSISQDGNRVTLATADVTIVFLDREVADPDRPLEGTTWDVTGSVEGETVSSVPTGGSIVLRDGTVEIDTGCNTGNGSYEVAADGTSVTFGPIGLTRMACQDEEAARLEQAMVGVLHDTVSIEIVAAALTITQGDLGLQLTARE